MSRWGPGAATVVGFLLLGTALATVVDWALAARWLTEKVLLFVGLLFVGLLLIAWGLVRHSRARSHASDRSNQSSPLSWWAVATAGTIIACVTVGATAWLLREANSAKDPPAARVEALKTGLGAGAGAGAGGIFALLLAVRRQWHQERSSASAELDATERRITELYTRASEQLGSEKAHVRMAGLYAMERLAQDNPKQRQMIVNVLCAYLRMPHVATELLAGADRSDQTQADFHLTDQEQEVRLAAERIITKHLRPVGYEGEPLETFWSGINLDLSGAVLLELNLYKCMFGRANFNSAIFCNKADFSGSTFLDYSSFRSARFTKSADFSSANFSYVSFSPQYSLVVQIFMACNLTPRAVSSVHNSKARSTFDVPPFVEPRVLTIRTLFEMLTFKVRTFYATSSIGAQHSTLQNCEVLVSTPLSILDPPTSPAVSNLNIPSFGTVYQKN